MKCFLFVSKTAVSNLQFLLSMRKAAVNNLKFSLNNHKFSLSASKTAVNKLRFSLPVNKFSLRLFVLMLSMTKTADFLSTSPNNNGRS